MLLGQEVETDDSLEWRVKWGQRGVGIVWFACVDMLDCKTKLLATIVFAALVVLYFLVCYITKTSRLLIAKRLLRETNVVIILVLALCNWSIDIARPSNSLAPVNGLIYMIMVSAFVFLDAVKVKSRVCDCCWDLFVLANINNIYGKLFGDLDQGVVLFNYSIQGNKYTFMKRSVKRSIFIQIVLFSMNGIYTIFKDRKQELMIFATGNIYRETGTASKEVEHKNIRKIKSEKRTLSV